MHLLRRIFASSIIAAVVVFYSSSSCDNPSSPTADWLGWEIDPDSVNFAILRIDYTTGDFKGASLNRYPPCSSCKADSLPILEIYDGRGDGYITTFVHRDSGDTLYWAIEVWNGRGAIMYPTDFLPPDSFVSIPVPGPEPSHRKYFHRSGPWPDSTFEEKAGSVWKTIRNLNLVVAFAQHNYIAGFLLYKPSTGLIDWKIVEWLIFLSSGGVESRIDSPSIGRSLRLKGKSPAREGTPAKERVGGEPGRCGKSVRLPSLARPLIIAYKHGRIL